MTFRVVYPNGDGVPEVVDEDEADALDTPILDRLLEMDDLDKRHCELLRMLVFKRLDVQLEINVATIHIGLHGLDERCDYAKAISGIAQMSRSDHKMLWNAARALRGTIYAS